MSSIMLSKQLPFVKRLPLSKTEADSQEFQSMRNNFYQPISLIMLIRLRVELKSCNNLTLLEFM